MNRPPGSARTILTSAALALGLVIAATQPGAADSWRWKHHGKHHHHHHHRHHHDGPVLFYPSPPVVVVPRPRVYYDPPSYEAPGYLVPSGRRPSVDMLLRF